MMFFVTTAAEECCRNFTTRPFGHQSRKTRGRSGRKGGGRGGGRRKNEYIDK